MLLRRLALHPDLIEHGERTARYAARLGDVLGLSPDDLIDLHYACLLHDIGKLTLPRAILHKEGSLSADEYALLQSHPRAGAELLSSIAFLRRPAVWISHHHERWDGSGYPYGLRAAFIPLGARILAIADTFDALTSNQLSHTASDGESAHHLLRLVAGTQLDPDLVPIFLECNRTRVEGDGAREMEDDDKEGRSGLCHPLTIRCETRATAHGRGPRFLRAPRPFP